MSDISNNLEPDVTVYKTLLESTKAIPWKLDWATMRFTYIGPQIEHLLGWTPESWATAQDWAGRMHPDDSNWVVDFCIEQSQAGIDHEADYRALTKNGDYIWIRDVVHVVRDEKGDVESLIGFMFDFSERKNSELKLIALQKELQDFSYKDGLTNVANRRMFDSVIENEWADAQRNSTSISMIMLDIDFFKQYNDHYGHIQGDYCLKRVAKILNDAIVRPRDFFARFGGEEFVMIMPETDATSAMLIAKRCQSMIEIEQIPHESSQISKVLTISLGVGTIIPTRKNKVISFIDEIDKRLYRAKEQGRNMIIDTCAST